VVSNPFFSCPKRLGVEQSDLLAEEPELAPLLAVTLSPGKTAGTTSATVIGQVYGSLVVNITEAEIATPYVGDPAPTTGDNLIASYESGVDITAGVAAGNYLQVYAVDMEDQARIVGFYQAELTKGDIKETDEEKGIEEYVEGKEENVGGLRPFGVVPMSSGGIVWTYELGKDNPADVTGTLYSNGTFVISGNGRMKDYSSSDLY